MDEVIFLLDEIDSSDTSQKLTKECTDVSPKEEKQSSPTFVINTSSKEPYKMSDDSFDKFNIGMFLNILDGCNDQDGMILIGTANNHKNLDPAVYRNGRMELINFEYMDRNDITDMIQHYWKVILTDEQKLKIRNDKTVQSLTLKNVCLKYIKKKQQHKITIDELIDELNHLFDLIDDDDNIKTTCTILLD
jgi:SpoVK/Ycf46/Vps4 family AAA+-type ATPase